MPLDIMHNMRIYFAPNGIGLGHASRCVAIAKELQANGVEVFFSTYGKAYDYVKGEGLEVASSPPIMWSERSDGALDYKSTVLRTPLMCINILRHFRTERKRLIAFKPDIVVSDTRYSVIPAAKNVGATRVFITNQPRIVLPKKDNGKTLGIQGFIRRLNYKLISGQDLIMLPDFPMPHSISYRHMAFDDEIEPRLRERLRFIGPVTPYGPEDVTSEKKAAVRERYCIESDEVIYIALSGPGRSRVSAKYMLSRILKDMEMDSIMTTGVPATEPKIRREGRLILVDGWIPERAALLSIARAIVCRAGLSTLSEVVRFGLPCVVFPTRNQPEQESNAEGIERLGLARSIKAGNVSLDNIYSALRHVLGDVGVSKKSRFVQGLSRKYNGKVLGAKALMELLV